ncbi:hypothetical protein D915_001795 [Fasciola hepatica]|uniref:BZIP domain-containing protein n=1 Tax=Fasciola hepatica TaxID=6192 RepID=A0A4E0RK01_FASHE|nr:hypothetical protein D915_001795 [Fasciola hepatica]
MEPTQNSDEVANGSVKRPTTLNLLLSPMDSSLRSSFDRTPQRSVVEIIEALLQSPQNLRGFLGTDEAEQLGNNLLQKLAENKDFGCLTPIIRPTASMSGTEETSLADIDSPMLYNFVCQQAAAQQQQSNVSTPIILCSPTNLSQPLTEALNKLSTSVATDQSITIDTSTLSCDLNAVQTALQNALSIALPGASKDLSSLQVCNGGPHQLDLGNTPVDNANIAGTLLSQPAGLKLEQMAAELSSTLSADQSHSLATDPLFWRLLIQTSIANDHTVSHQFDTRGATTTLLGSSPLDEHDTTRPSSVTNGTDPVGELDRVTTAAGTLAFRSSSSPVSSNSSLSQTHAPDSGSRDTRLDPTEQSRMRLERKRARNRDAARKCRERKIVLIKRLEKEVVHLTEENKVLRNRYFRCMREIDRLKLFVVQHLRNQCPVMVNKHG